MRPALTAIAASRTTASTRQGTSTSPTGTSSRHHPIFKLKRGVPSIRRALMPKLLYLVTEDWFFVSHFLPMARTAKAAGFEVVVATRVGGDEARIAAGGWRVGSLEGGRRGVVAFEPLRGFFRMVRTVREERPDIVHCIALRRVVPGGLPARFGGAK